MNISAYLRAVATSYTERIVAIPYLVSHHTHGIPCHPAPVKVLVKQQWSSRRGSFRICTIRFEIYISTAIRIREYGEIIYCACGKISKSKSLVAKCYILGSGTIAQVKVIWNRCSVYRGNNVVSFADKYNICTWQLGSCCICPACFNCITHIHCAKIGRIVGRFR